MLKSKKKKNRWRATAFLDPSWNPSEKYYVFWGSWRGSGPGGGGYPWFQVTRMIEWLPNSKPKKTPGPKPPKKSHAEFPSHTNLQKNYVARIRGNYHASSDCFENQKKTLLKSTCPKTTCQHFPTQIIPEIENFKPKKILRSSLALEIRRSPPWLVQETGYERRWTSMLKRNLLQFM